MTRTLLIHLGPPHCIVRHMKVTRTLRVTSSKVWIFQTLLTADEDGRTPLHLAVLDDHLDIVRFIMERVDDPNPADQEGSTPLHYAALCGHLDIVRLFIERGEDPNLANEEGHTPLMFAQLYGHQEVCQHIKNAIGVI